MNFPTRDSDLKAHSTQNKLSSKSTTDSNIDESFNFKINDGLNKDGNNFQSQSQSHSLKDDHNYNNIKEKKLNSSVSNMYDQNYGYNDINSNSSKDPLLLDTVLDYQKNDDIAYPISSEFSNKLDSQSSLLETPLLDKRNMGNRNSRSSSFLHPQKNTTQGLKTTNSKNQNISSSFSKSIPVSSSKNELQSSTSIKSTRRRSLNKFNDTNSEQIRDKNLNVKRTPSVIFDQLDSSVPNMLSLPPISNNSNITSTSNTSSTPSYMFSSSTNPSSSSTFERGPHSPISLFWTRISRIAKKYGAFIGPGMMVSVAYIDPGNYSTDVAAGASYKFKLLFVVLLSNIFAIFLQALCVKLGSVTGIDLATNCREHLPYWLNIMLYICAEICIIATDLAEVIGTAISLNILFHISLPIGVIITIIDVLVVLLAYKPDGSVKGIRMFEYAVAALVMAVVICFVVELAHITSDATFGEVLRGYLPSSVISESKALYQACGILGATVMPHSLYLGSGLVQPRLKDYDMQHGFWNDDSISSYETKYRPSVPAIKFAYTYSLVELTLSLTTFALFVNSAILIVAGATLSGNPDASPENADLFSIYELLSTHISPAAGVVFALALLFSGLSAGIVCTIAGQMVSEGFLNWTMVPWLRRVVTRGIAVVPTLIIAISLGRQGMNDALNASQFILSLFLPFVTAPLIYFTCNKDIMRVPVMTQIMVDEDLDTPENNSMDINRNLRTEDAHRDDFLSNPEEDSLESNDITDSPLIVKHNNNNTHRENGQQNFNDDNTRAQQQTLIERTMAFAYVDMSNSWVVSILAVGVWFFISILNITLLVLLGKGLA